MLRSLAEEVLDEYRNGYLLASRAAALYKGLSGSARPMLDVLATHPGSGRVLLALRSITVAPPKSHEAQVLLYACDAAWRLTSFSKNRNFAVSMRSNGLAEWSFDLEKVILEVRRLLQNSATVEKVVEAEKTLRIPSSE
jgi:hypothetical protein